MLWTIVLVLGRLLAKFSALKIPQVEIVESLTSPFKSGNIVFQVPDLSNLSWQCDSLNIVKNYFKRVCYECHRVLGSKGVISILVTWKSLIFSSHLACLWTVGIEKEAPDFLLACCKSVYFSFPILWSQVLENNYLDFQALMAPILKQKTLFNLVSFSFFKLTVLANWSQELKTQCLSSLWMVDTQSPDCHLLPPTVWVSR